MLDYGLDRTRELIRKSTQDITALKVSLGNEVLDDAVAYFDRTSDHQDLKGALKQRFATGIVKQPYDSSGVDTDSGYETYRKGDVETQIDVGHIEVLTTGVGSRIISALANLFTSETQIWQYSNEQGEQNEDAEELVNAHREAGGFTTKIVDADWLACAINGSFLYVNWVGGHLKYHVVSPTCFHVLFHNEIMDNGESRAVDYTELEDATAIVIKLSDGQEMSAEQQQYLAIFGRSELYPYGRHVVYKASQWANIPDPGPNAIDYEINGELANPLSYMAATNKDQIIPEYPVIALHGGFARAKDGIVATTTSLYENCSEVDIAASRLLRAAQNAARGVNIVTNEQNKPLPRSLEGDVALSGGQTLTIDGRDASHSQAAMQVLQDLIVLVGGGYNVPDYQVVSNPDSLSQASGVSLMVRSQALLDFRQYRIKLNSPSVKRLWEIERNLITAYAPEEGSKLTSVDLDWDPGRIRIPEDKTEIVNRLGQAQDKGYIDYVRAVREYHNLPTDADAMALIDTFNERKTEYPGASVKKIAAPIGLTRQP